MNDKLQNYTKKLQDYAKSVLKDGLSQCTDAQQVMFKKMYAHNEMNKDINDIVDPLPEDKLDWAMQQVERTLRRRGGEE